jgi:hypothetical protein
LLAVPVEVADRDGDLASGRLRVVNRNAFTDLSAYEARWTLSEDGTVIGKGTLPALSGSRSCTSV